MNTDKSRVMFNAWKDFDGLVQQQGRVNLESEWNEWVDESIRRIRAGTLDTLGHAVYPATTPNAFLITPTAGSVSIGVGRMYVDGFLAENHGMPSPGSQGWVPPNSGAAGPQPAWDPYLDELVGQNALDYSQQPYFPGVALQAPFPTTGGPFLVYLDVWQREITFLEDPDLIEKAVGLDTTGRLQTAWQVRLLDVSAAGNVTCATNDSDIGPWENLIQPTARRLTTGVVQSAASGPCCLAPNTGYTGMENQLYRVEIHQKGSASSSPVGTFKWSRDNASVATAVSGITTGGTVLTVQNTGKDSVLRFSPNDWVEITDDWLELNGQHGELHQVALVSDATHTITLSTAASSTSFPVDANGLTDPTRHTRLIRWDQKGKVYQSDGVTVWKDLDAAGSAGIPIPPPGTSLILENGIIVSFDLNPSPGSFFPLDSWTFAARTADGTVEKLVEAPPRGVHHHYARLAILTLPSTASDCRIPWPPTGTTTATTTCCCTVTVKPEDLSGNKTLQSIIDQFAGQSGITICLAPGTYALPAPLVLARQHSSFTLEGCHGSVFFTAVAGAEGKFLDGLVVVSEATGVTLRDLTFVLPSVPFLKAGGQLSTLTPEILARAGGPTVKTMSRLDASIGIRPIDAVNLAIEDCAFQFPALDPANADANTFAVGVFGWGLNDRLTLQGNSFVRSSSEPAQISAEPFRVSIGYLLTPGASIKTIKATEASAEFRGSVVRPSILGATIRRNMFSGLTAAILTYAEPGTMNVDDNSADSCYAGFWILGRRTQPDASIGTSDTDKQLLNDILLDPLLVLGSTIGRCYPLPIASKIKGKSVSGTVKLINPNPLKSNPTLALFYVLQQFVASMEAKAAVGTTLSSLALHCANNRVDALWTPGPESDSGEALVVWGEDGDFESSLVLNANKLRNNASPLLSTAAIVSMSRCSINGSVILNICSSTPGWCLYVILTTGQSSLTAGMAVTGNVLQSNTNLPANWLAMNSQV